MAYVSATQSVVVFGGFTASFAPSADTWSLGYQAVVQGESCGAGFDADGDGAIGCADQECWTVCTPQCAPGAPMASCPAGAPACGDSMCDAFETCRSCPGDCALGGAACPLVCGDSFCDPGETAVSCPGDC
jgi:hypothetical protein